MIPSDHFVKFYSEIFKYLEKQGRKAVDEYYLTISRHQENHCLELFQKKGIVGMNEYWEQIKKEENCDMDILIDGDNEVYKEFMHGCPSLGKVLDNDAGPSPIYCEHCPGWVLPLMTKAGFYCVYDLIGMDIPRCQFAVFKVLECARKYRDMALKRNPKHPELIRCNFD